MSKAQIQQSRIEHLRAVPQWVENDVDNHDDYAVRCQRLVPGRIGAAQPMPQPRAQWDILDDTAPDRGPAATRRRPGLSGA